MNAHDWFYSPTMKKKFGSVDKFRLIGRLWLHWFFLVGFGLLHVSLCLLLIGFANWLSITHFDYIPKKPGEKKELNSTAISAFIPHLLTIRLLISFSFVKFRQIVIHLPCACWNIIALCQFLVSLLFDLKP